MSQACHAICTLPPPWQYDSHKTRNTARPKCCACHAKWRWRSPKCCACQENAIPLLITSQMYCACHTERLLSPHETCCDVTKCHTCHTKQGCTTFDFKSDHFCRRLPRSTARPHTNGGERLRTVADGCATSSEHTLNPQTPRVKREPLLCIRENQGEQGETAGSTLVISPNKKKWVSCKIQKVKVSQNTPKILHL